MKAHRRKTTKDKPRKEPTAGRRRAVPNDNSKRALAECRRETIEPMATKNGNRIVIECPADLGTMHADQTRFR
jgi:hypothetical protein